MKKQSEIFREINLNLSKEINLKKIEHKKNKLECIFLNICDKDCKNFEIFKKQIIHNTNINFAKKINFIIFKNKNFEIDVNFLKKIFKNAKTVNLDLETKDDLYMSYKFQHVFVNQKIPIPIYGTKSGPNIMFLKAINLLRDQNTSLLLETDCLLAKDWLEKLVNYTEHCNGFWISGATYDGGMYSSDELMLNHINGVALYATGNTYFQIFMKYFDQYLRESIKNNDPFLAYDWAMKIFINENLKSEENHLLWKFIKRNYLVNNLIFNYSLKEDEIYQEEKIMKIYNYAILHKKIKS